MTSLYRYGPGPTGSWEHHYVTFSGSLVDRLHLPLLESLAPNGISPVTNLPQLAPAFIELITRVQDSMASLESRIHLLNHILYLVSEGTWTSYEKTDNRLARIRKQIDANPLQSISFPDLARQEGFSYSSFRRQFREQFGCPPGQYLIKRRLQLAARQLVSSRQCVHTIGQAHGYEDPSRFSRVFKQHYGFSPRHYREAGMR